MRPPSRARRAAQDPRSPLERAARAPARAEGDCIPSPEKVDLVRPHPRQRRARVTRASKLPRLRTWSMFEGRPPAVSSTTICAAPAPNRRVFVAYTSSRERYRHPHFCITYRDCSRAKFVAAVRRQSEMEGLLPYLRRRLPPLLRIADLRRRTRAPRCSPTKHPKKKNKTLHSIIASA